MENSIKDFTKKILNFGQEKVFPIKTKNSYQSRVDNQIKQFSGEINLKKLPKIHSYYMKKFLHPRIKEVFGCDAGLFYIAQIEQVLIGNLGLNRILSVGSGDCNLEVTIASRLIERGADNFVIECHELSPIRLERGRELAKSRGVESYLEFHETDFNNMCLKNRYSIVLAHHTLHHIVELEKLFSEIHKSLIPNGRFITIDMIGRNGHMRWPESLELIEMIWNKIPDRYKYNHQFEKHHSRFINWDCSKRGFEGIRSQDVLPLINNEFNCEKFYAFGNLPDIFIERGYGHNLDVNNQPDTDFIDLLEELNDQLINMGYLKPTIMYGVFCRKDRDIRPRVYKHRTPEFCVRQVEAIDKDNKEDDEAYFQRIVTNFDRKPGDYMRDNIFTIVCPARSGSTMLVHLLRSHPDIWSNGEVFLGNGKIGALMGTYRQKSLKDSRFIEKLEKERQNNIRHFIYKYVFDNQNSKVCGFKFKLDEFVQSQYKEIYDILVNDTDIKIIFLTRDNLLKRYLSWYLVNHVTQTTFVKDEKEMPKHEAVKLDPEKCLEDFERTLQRQKSAKEIFNNHRLIHITYEDLVGNKETTERALCKFLSVPYYPLETTTKNILRKGLPETIENFEELKDYFSNTKFSSFFP